MCTVEFFIACSPMPTPLPFSTPVRRALADAESALKEIYGDRLKKLIVYGSQARGDARPDSDVDLMVVLSGKVHPDEEAQRTSRLLTLPRLKPGDSWRVSPPLTGQQSDLMELSLRQRSSSHRITQSGFRFAGSAMMPATRVGPRYFLFAVWRLWYGPSFEVPCRSNCSGRGREGLPPHCRLSRKTLQTLISIGSVSLRSTRRVPEPTGSYVPAKARDLYCSSRALLNTVSRAVARKRTDSFTPARGLSLSLRRVVVCTDGVAASAASLPRSGWGSLAWRCSARGVAAPAHGR